MAWIIMWERLAIYMYNMYNISQKIGDGTIVYSYSLIGNLKGNCNLHM